MCGLTDAGDARLAVELGAAMLGFNFYPRSPRYIAPAQARPIIAAMPASIETVGVFVNATLEEIASAIAASGVNSVQLHGDEPAEFCRRLKQRLPGVSIIKAFRTEPGFAPETAVRYPADTVLIDAACVDFGGSGLQADWERARAVPPYCRAQFWRADSLPAMLPKRFNGYGPVRSMFQRRGGRLHQGPQGFRQDA